MRILWYWPHPHRDENGVAAALEHDGDTVTVECLSSFAGEQLSSDISSYTVVRDLPDVARSVGSTARRLADRALVHGRRVTRRQQLVRRGRFDVVHIHMIAPMLDAAAVPLLHRRAATVIHVHDVVPHTSRFGRAEWLALRAIYHSADRLLVFHDVLRDALITQFGLDPARVDVVPHPLTMAEAAPAARGDGPLQVLFFGSLRANKGVGMLLQAMQLVDPSLVELTIAGGGDATLEAAVREADRERSNVHPRVGFVDAADKIELFARADLAVLPYGEGFGSQSGVLLDAYSSGLPVVVTDTGAIGPTVRDDDTGWVVAPGDAAELAQALTDAGRDRSRWSEARDHVVQARRRHAAGAVAAVYRASYDKALASRGNARATRRR